MYVYDHDDGDDNDDDNGDDNDDDDNDDIYLSGLKSLLFN
jgi:hypothetical protein